MGGIVKKLRTFNFIGFVFSIIVQIFNLILFFASALPALRSQNLEAIGGAIVLALCIILFCVIAVVAIIEFICFLVLCKKSAKNEEPVKVLDFICFIFPIIFVAIDFILIFLVR